MLRVDPVVDGIAIALAALFCLAGAVKVVRPPTEPIHLPTMLGRVAVPKVVIRLAGMIEVSLGSALLLTSGSDARATAALIVAALSLFVFINYQAAAAGRPCGCFGTATTGAAGRVDIAISALTLLAGVAVLANGFQPGSPRVEVTVPAVAIAALILSCLSLHIVGWRLLHHFALGDPPQGPEAASLHSTRRGFFSFTARSALGALAMTFLRVPWANAQVGAAQSLIAKASSSNATILIEGALARLGHQLDWSRAAVHDYSGRGQFVHVPGTSVSFVWQSDPTDTSISLGGAAGTLGALALLPQDAKLLYVVGDNAPTVSTFTIPAEYQVGLPSLDCLSCRASCLNAFLFCLHRGERVKTCEMQLGDCFRDFCNGLGGPCSQEPEFPPDPYAPQIPPGVPIIIPPLGFALFCFAAWRIFVIRMPGPALLRMEFGDGSYEERTIPASTGDPRDDVQLLEFSHEFASTSLAEVLVQRATVEETGSFALAITVHPDPNRARAATNSGGG